MCTIYTIDKNVQFIQLTKMYNLYNRQIRTIYTIDKMYTLPKPTNICTFCSLQRVQDV